MVIIIIMMKHLHHYLKIYCSNSSPNIGLFSGSDLQIAQPLCQHGSRGRKWEAAESSSGSGVLGRASGRRMVVFLWMDAMNGCFKAHGMGK